MLEIARFIIQRIYFTIQQQVRPAMEEEELEAVENTLRKCAQQLGELNLSNNRLQETNQELAHQIQRLQAKISRKAHSIEQEVKDKQIIHQKLVKAQQVRQELQIRHEKLMARHQQEKLRVLYESERQASLHSNKQQSNISESTEFSHKQESKSNPIISTKIELSQSKPCIDSSKVNSVNSTIQPSAVQSIGINAINSNQQSSKKVGKQQKQFHLAVGNKPTTIQKSFQNAEKGEYQPPALLFDQNESDQDSEQDNSKVLQKLKEKLKQQRQQLDQDDED